MKEHEKLKRQFEVGEGETEVDEGEAKCWGGGMS